jgi:tRNA (mo5U34)-methyltransferase
MTPDESLDLKAARLLLNTTQDLEAKGWYHSLELPNGEVIQGTQSLDRLERRLSKLPIPQDLRGKRVLDIGAWDGWFSFAMERRGAEVLAVDCVEIENFRYARRKLGSRVDYQIMDVFEITPERVGRFDIVLCLGVIYHLKHPLLAIERVCDLTTDLAIVESFVADENLTHVEYPWMEFYESDELGGQADNWSGPVLNCWSTQRITAPLSPAIATGISHLPAAAVLVRFCRWRCIVKTMASISIPRAMSTSPPGF